MVMQKVSELTSSAIGDALANIRTWGYVFYNVKEHGLIGDGATDDTFSLQQLIDLAKKEGRTAIFFPHGDYYVTNLTNTDGIYFFGDNASFVGGYTGVITQIGAQPIIDTKQDKPAMLYSNAIENIALIPGNSLRQAANAAKGGSLRIMFAGDSITYGADQKSYNDTYAYKVEQALRSGLQGVNVVSANYSLGSRRLQEFMNPNFKGMASPPADPLQGFSESWSTVGKSWLDTVKDYAPDLLVAAFGMNDSYAVPTNADDNDAQLWTALLVAIKTWPYTPSVVFVSTMLPTKKQDRGLVLDQNVMNSIARAAREVGSNNGVAVADANRLYNVLVNGQDEMNTKSEVEYNFADYYDDTKWTGNKNQFSLSNNELVPLDMNPKFVTRTRKCYDGKIELDAKFVNSTDTLWINYRIYENQGSLVIFVTPSSTGNGSIGLYSSDSGTAIANVGGLDIPFNDYRKLRLEFRGSRHQVYLNGNRVIDAITYKKLQNGDINFGSNQSPGIIKNLSITYEVPSTVVPSYTEDDILGLFNSTESGNGLNHPSALGHEMVYFPAFNGVVRTLSGIQRNNEIVSENTKINIAVGATLDLFSLSYTSGQFKSAFVEITTTGLFQGVGARVVTTTYQVLWSGSSGNFSVVSNNAAGSADADKLSHITTSGGGLKISVKTVGTAAGSDLKSTIRVVGDGCRVNPL